MRQSGHAALPKEPPWWKCSWWDLLSVKRRSLWKPCVKQLCIFHAWLIQEMSWLSNVMLVFYSPFIVQLWVTCNSSHKQKPQGWVSSLDAWWKCIFPSNCLWEGTGYPQEESTHRVTFQKAISRGSKSAEHPPHAPPLMYVCLFISTGKECIANPPCGGKKTLGAVMHQFYMHK